MSQNSGKCHERCSVGQKADYTLPQMSDGRKNTAQPRFVFVYNNMNLEVLVSVLLLGVFGIVLSLRWFLQLHLNMAITLVIKCAKICPTVYGEHGGTIVMKIPSQLLSAE